MSGVAFNYTVPPRPEPLRFSPLCPWAFSLTPGWAPGPLLRCYTVPSVPRHPLI